MESSFPSLRKPTAREATATVLLLLPFLCSLVYRLYAKVQRRAGRSVGLQILSESSSDEDIKYEIVAVHGLGANPEHTWTCKSSIKSTSAEAQAPVHLLKDLLMKDDRFSDACILHFAYNSDWLVDACFESARDIGLRLMESLLKHREIHARLPLIFVGHSFGGIVIKEALSSNPDDTQKILEDTCGVIFLGTPHLGSPIAGYGATIAYLTGFLGSNTGLLLSLRSTGDLLVNLSRDFQQCVNRKKRDTNKETEIVSICEKKASYFLNWLYAGKIVPWESAAFGSNFADVIEVDKDHSGLNKSLNSEDPLYKELTAQLCRMKPNVPPKINKLQQAVIDRLAPVIASDAEFHPGGDEYRGLSECLPHTREQLLNDICDWFDEFDSSQKHLYWLQGKAGTGKSTIARTVVSRMTRKKRIVANFFFKRGEGDRARLKRFFTTLSAQLVRKLPSLAQMVQDALESEPSLPEQSPRIQFRKLIQEPLQTQTSSHDKAIVIVVDALDECDSKEDLTNLVQQLSQSIVRIQGDQSSSGQLLVKYFITSRLDHHTQSDFNRVPEDISEKKELESATSDTTKQDIECYLKIHLQNIDGFLDPLPNSGPWSNPADVEILKKLADRASPLFEFAAAACRYISQPTIPGGPRTLIQDVLASNNYGGLDGIYLPILRRRFVNLKGPLRDRARTAFQDVIGSVLCLADSVTVPCLAKLLGQNELAVHQELLLLQSVLVVPKKQDSPLPISLFHESFRDFLIGPEANDEFKLDIRNIRSCLATRCLELLRGALKENLCNLKSPGTYRSDVDEETILRSISEEIQYACRFWTHHLKECGIHLSDGDEWHLFLSSHFLHWLEALALLGKFFEIVPLVRELQVIIHPTEGTQIRAFLDDANRFVLYFGHIINTAPLQTYSSALTFSPPASVIRKTFDACRPGWIARTPIVEAQWSPCLQTLEGDSFHVTGLAFSSEGLLACGAPEGLIEIWDLKSGNCLHTLSIEIEMQPDGDDNMGITFSKTGKIACWTGTSLALWEVNQGDRFEHFGTLDNKLDLHTRVCMAFTDEEKLVLVNSRSGEVFKWDLGSGFETIFSNASGQSSDLVVPSSDGQWVAHADGWEVQVFRTNSIDSHSSDLLLLHEYSDDPRYGAAFSPDNQYLAIWQTGGDVEIFDVASARNLQCLPTLTVSGIDEPATFSPDGRLIARGHCGGEIIIWDWQGHMPIQLKTLVGHRDFIRSVAFSPDGALLASASNDRTVKVWDVSIQSCKEKPEWDWRSDQMSISMAMDGQRFVTSSEAFGAHEYQLWNDYGRAYTVVPFASIRGVQVSANGKISAAYSDDDIEVWDVQKGCCSPKLICRWSIISQGICSIALSADGGRLVTGSLNEGYGIIEVWQSRTGVKEFEHREPGQEAQVAIAFDGERVAFRVNKTVQVKNLRGKRSLTWENPTRSGEGLAFSPNGNRLAIVGLSSEVTIWDLTTGACIRRSKAEPGGFDWHCLLVLPFIDFDFPLAADLPEEISAAKLWTKYHVSRDCAWIMRHSQKLLWLPPEYRPARCAASGASVAIVPDLGRPYVISLSDGGLEDPTP